MQFDDVTVEALMAFYEDQWTAEGGPLDWVTENPRVCLPQATPEHWVGDYDKVCDHREKVCDLIEKWMEDNKDIVDPELVDRYYELHNGNHTSRLSLAGYTVGWFIFAEVSFWASVGTPNKPIDQQAVFASVDRLLEQCVI